MANLKELRGRINSVKSTEKITSAMKMVAASRLRRAQLLIGQSSFYYDNILVLANRTLNILKRETEEEDEVFALPKILEDNAKKDKYLLVVFSSDRGLCGGYNYNVVKAVKLRISELKNKEIKILCIGRKARDLLKRDYSELILDVVEGVAHKGADYGESNQISDMIAKLMAENSFDICEVIYSKFHSVLNRENVCQQFFPLVLPEVEEDKKGLVKDNISGVYYEYEPNEKQTLEILLDKFSKIVLYQVMVNSQASEHGARMTSMDGATRNAKDMISKLTLKYNQLRQSSITTELIEIISGAEAI